MTINFLTFGSHSNHIEAGERLLKQAKSLDLFHNLDFYKSDDLKKDKDFWNRHGAFIENNKRGYGYWLWKSYLINKTIQKLKNGNILLYCDSGSEIVKSEKQYLLEYIEAVKKYKILAHILYVTNEYAFSKMDLILKLGMTNYGEVYFCQIEAGVILLEVNDLTRNFINKWYELCCDYHNIDDSPSINPNVKFFYEHRHDQSIFSLLIKKYKLINDILKEDKCIKYIRNNSGKSRFDGIVISNYNYNFRNYDFINKHIDKSYIYNISQSNQINMNINKKINNNKSNMDKNIFLLWLQGWDNARYLQKQVAESWKINNPEWKIHYIDINNIKNYVDDIDYLFDKNKQITFQAASDIIRLSLLNKYGGVWADATMLCMQPLDHWVFEAVEPGGIWMYHGLGGGLPKEIGPASWFIISKKEDYIISKWKEACDYYWYNNNTANDYFWMDLLFKRLLFDDEIFKNKWLKVPYIYCGLDGQSATLATHKIENDTPHIKKLLEEAPPYALKMQDYWNFMFPDKNSDLCKKSNGYYAIQLSKRNKYHKMINIIKNIPNIRTYPLKYVFENMKLQHKENTLWLEFGVASGNTINYIASFTNNKVYGFDSFEGLPEKWRDGFEKGFFSRNGILPNVNNNVELIKGWFNETLVNFIKIQNKKITFIHIDCDLYSSTKYILDTIINYIDNNCIIIFDELVNYPGFDGDNGELKAFYEFITENNVDYEWIGMNGVPIGMNGYYHENVAVIIKSINTNKN